MDSHDGEIESALAGLSGAIIRWTSTREGFRALCGGLIAGAGIGYYTNALICWVRADVPKDVRVGTAIFMGTAALILVAFFIRQVQRFTRAGGVAERAMDAKAAEYGVAPDGRVTGTVTSGSLTERTVTHTSVVVGQAGGEDSDPATPRVEPR